MAPTGRRASGQKGMEMEMEMELETLRVMARESSDLVVAAHRDGTVNPLAEAELYRAADRIAAIREWQKSHCPGYRFADAKNVGTGKPCCTFPGKLVTGTGPKCATRKGG